jgi:putative chitinase
MATKGRKRRGPPRSLQIGMKGPAVKALQKQLLAKGFNPGPADGVFGNGTQAAVIGFQRSEGLLADGIVGPRTRAALVGQAPAPLDDVTGKFDVVAVSRMFPHTPIGNIARNLPFVIRALKAAKLHDKVMVLAALATIRAETESFEPVPEGLSRYNTSPTGEPFDLYDHRKDLGNRGSTDGHDYRGRGYVQLTGRFNYEKYGRLIGLGASLVQKPDRATKPEIAAQLLAVFIGDRERPLKEALLDLDFPRARRLVNGGTHGLDRFVAAYRTGLQIAES